MGFSLPHHGSPKEPEEAPSPPSGPLPFLDPLDALTNVAFRSKADIGQPLPTNLDFEPVSGVQEGRNKLLPRTVAKERGN